MKEEIKCPITLCNKHVKRERKGLLKHIVEKAFTSDIYGDDKVEQKIAQNHKHAVDVLGLNIVTKISDEELIEKIKRISYYPHPQF